ncbi:MAG: hypothetical protein QME66_05555 [Candidatus Eisenbacteria bacterium]|nr:hypothetical protein [Candidatus Eisenbacteria bacterium]
MDRVPGDSVTKREELYRVLGALTKERASWLIQAILNRNQDYVFTQLAQLGYFDAIEQKERHVHLV